MTFDDFVEQVMTLNKGKPLEEGQQLMPSDKGIVGDSWTPSYDDGHWTKYDYDYGICMLDGEIHTVLGTVDTDGDWDYTSYSRDEWDQFQKEMNSDHYFEQWKAYHEWVVENNGDDPLDDYYVKTETQQTRIFRIQLIKTIAGYRIHKTRIGSGKWMGGNVLPFEIYDFMGFKKGVDLKDKFEDKDDYLDLVDGCTQRQEDRKGSVIYKDKIRPVLNRDTLVIRIEADMDVPRKDSVIRKERIAIARKGIKENRKYLTMGKSSDKVAA